MVKVRTWTEATDHRADLHGRLTRRDESRESDSGKELIIRASVASWNE